MKKVCTNCHGSVFIDGHYYQFDALGSVVGITDSAGSLVESYDYDIYGSFVRSGTDVGNPYFFTGRRYDTETSLYYYRARYYSPIIGRFLQTDPVYYMNGPNLYTYVLNNPLNRIDPYGLKLYKIQEAEGSLSGFGRASVIGISRGDIMLTDLDTGDIAIYRSYSGGGAIGAHVSWLGEEGTIVDLPLSNVTQLSGIWIDQGYVFGTVEQQDSYNLWRGLKIESWKGTGLTGDTVIGLELSFFLITWFRLLEYFPGDNCTK